MIRRRREYWLISPFPLSRTLSIYWVINPIDCRGDIISIPDSSKVVTQGKVDGVFSIEDKEKWREFYRQKEGALKEKYGRMKCIQKTVLLSGMNWTHCGIGCYIAWYWQSISHHQLSSSLIIWISEEEFIPFLPFSIIWEMMSIGVYSSSLEVNIHYSFTKYTKTD